MNLERALVEMFVGCCGAMWVFVVLKIIVLMVMR
jgi:hypothetical protein